MPLSLQALRQLGESPDAPPPVRPGTQPLPGAAAVGSVVPAPEEGEENNALVLYLASIYEAARVDFDISDEDLEGYLVEEIDKLVAEKRAPEPPAEGEFADGSKEEEAFTAALIGCDLKALVIARLAADAAE